MKKSKLKGACLCALFAALFAVSAWIAVPSVPPFTAQTLVLFCSVGLLGAKKSATAVFIYLALGAVGLPVFAGFRGGVGALFDVSGGYLIGFLLAALLPGAIIHRYGTGVRTLSLAFCAGLLVCYLFGSAWYYILYSSTTGGIGFGSVLLMCVLPFLPGDAVKIALAVLVTKRFRKLI